MSVSIDNPGKIRNASDEMTMVGRLIHHFRARKGELYAVKRCEECGVKLGWFVNLADCVVWQGKCFCTLRGDRKDETRKEYWQSVARFMLDHPALADMLFAFDMDAVDVEETDVCSGKKEGKARARRRQVRSHSHAKIHKRRRRA